jgi:cytidine deaminase
MCGERVALYNCAIQYPGEEIFAIAIVVRGLKPMTSPAPPCGACLQVIREFESRQNEKPIRILLKSDADVVWEAPSAKTMLPYSFDGSFL